MNVDLKKLIETNFLKFNYSVLQVLQPLTAIVLCELLAEYNYACKNNLSMDGHFLVDFRRFTDYVFSGDDVILDAIKQLDELHLITTCTPGMGDTLLVKVHEDSVVLFLEYCKNEYNPHEWDWNLKNTQNPRIQDVSFDHKTTNELMHFVNKNMKNPEKIPMVTYAFCNTVVNYYNLDKINFMENKDIQNLIKEGINRDDFEPMRLPEFINFLAEKMLKKENVESSTEEV